MAKRARSFRGSVTESSQFEMRTAYTTFLLSASQVVPQRRIVRVLVFDDHSYDVAPIVAIRQKVEISFSREYVPENEFDTGEETYLTPELYLAHGWRVTGRWSTETLLWLSEWGTLNELEDEEMDRMKILEANWDPKEDEERLFPTINELRKQIERINRRRENS